MALATAPPRPAPKRPPAPAPTLGLDPLELEELLVAVGDREDQAGTAARARLTRGRRALEAELARALDQ